MRRSQLKEHGSQHLITVTTHRNHHDSSTIKDAYYSSGATASLKAKGIVNTNTILHMARIEAVSTQQSDEKLGKYHHG